LIEQTIDHLPSGSISVELPEMPRNQSSSGFALLEGFRGDILVWARLGRDGKIERCHLRDPSWFQWPRAKCASSPR
jgi:Ni,Fe-hydrogenase III large subunit